MPPRTKICDDRTMKPPLSFDLSVRELSLVPIFFEPLAGHQNEGFRLSEEAYGCTCPNKSKRKRKQRDPVICPATEKPMHPALAATIGWFVRDIGGAITTTMRKTVLRT